MAETRYLERCGDRTHAGRRPRSYSLNVYEQSEAKSLAKRMEHTFECKVSKRKGLDAFKGNTRSEYIQASYMTLEKLFVELPESIRFSIEISELAPNVHKSKAETDLFAPQNIQCSLKLRIGKWIPTPWN